MKLCMRVLEGRDKGGYGVDQRLGKRESWRKGGGIRNDSGGTKTECFTEKTEQNGDKGESEGNEW